MPWHGMEQGQMYRNGQRERDTAQPLVPGLGSVEKQQPLNRSKAELQETEHQWLQDDRQLFSVHFIFW